jgi:hypothetical protein
LPSALIAPPADLAQEGFVRGTVGKVPAAAEQQRLRDCILEMAMRRLDVAVFVSRPRLDLLPDQSVMVQQLLITLREVTPLGQVVDGTAEPIAAVPLGHTAQLPERMLQPRAEALEALRATERYRLPIRVR